MRSKRGYARILIAILLHIGPCLSQNISCKDEEGNDVDWYVVYKLPKIKGEPKDSDLKEGIAYAYILAPGSTKWTLSDKNVEEDSIFEKTLDVYYKDKKEVTYLMYNDSPPGKTKHAAGHLKGLLVFDGETGFWLIHSVPKFADPKKYEYPKNGRNNGQTALCVTFKTSELNEIAKQLLYNSPGIYAYELTPEVEKQLDEDARSLFSDDPLFIENEPFTRETELKSLGGMKFNSFAKDNQLTEDLYSKIIAPSLKTSLIAETWRKGAGGIRDKVCKTDYTVLDVQDITFTFDQDEGEKTVSFAYTQDHSKWSISDEEANNYVCIGDLNRMVSQGKRGGGALCFESPKVIKAFEDIIEESDIC